jgi:hypothetical protein
MRRTLKLPELYDVADDPNPHFSELVYRHLPPSEWHKSYTRAKHSPSGGFVPGPDSSIVDGYQYELLLKVPDCDKHKLELAWTEWRRLGEYRNGETQRRDLYFTGGDWGSRWLLYQSLREGLAGSPEQRRDFEEEWTYIALQEMEDNPDWELWSDIEEAKESPIRPIRRVGTIMDADYFNRQNPELHLGRRCYYEG